MPVDLDAPARAVMATFGDKVQKGSLWRYTPKVGAAFDLDGLYDEAWSSVTIQNKGFGIAPVSTTKPCLLVRLADFPGGLAPQQGDGPLIQPVTGNTYDVADVSPDGFGCAHLSLNETS